MHSRSKSNPIERSAGPRWGGRLGIALIALLLAATSLAQPDDAGIPERLRAYVEDARQAPGVVVGISDVRGRRTFAYGSSGNPARPQLDADSVFEIGSITKIYTALLLAQMVEAGDVAYAQPIDTLFPQDIVLPEALRSITLEQLATHTSGLPRIALDPGLILRGVFGDDPYAGSTPDEIFRSVANVPMDQLGARGEFAYSNLGVALLGQLLARRMAADYAELLGGRVAFALQLPALPLQPLDPADPRRVQGYRENFRPAAAWHLDAYAPAGGLQASVSELLDFGERQLQSPHAWVRDAQAPRLSVNAEHHRRAALGWMIEPVGEREVWWHNGGTGGFRAHLAVIPAENRVVVVLSNGSGDADALARSLIDEREPPPMRPALDWVAAAATLGGLLLAPMLAMTVFARSRNPKVRPADRFDVFGTLISMALVLVLLERLGAWATLNFTLWWASATACLFLGVSLVWHARNYPWRAGTGAGHLVLRLLGIGVCGLVLVLMW